MIWSKFIWKAKKLKDTENFIEAYLSKIVILLINIYQSISLLSKPTCRFLPTCSEYAKEAFKSHGFYIGLKLTIKRISNCRPFGKSGYDPVPLSPPKGEENGH